MYFLLIKTSGEKEKSSRLQNLSSREATGGDVSREEASGLSSIGTLSAHIPAQHASSDENPQLLLISPANLSKYYEASEDIFFFIPLRKTNTLNTEHKSPQRIFSAPYNTISIHEIRHFGKKQILISIFGENISCVKPVSF